MKNKNLKFLIIALAIAFIIPQITLAAWWNPFSWGLWNNIFHFQQQNQRSATPVVGGGRDSHGCIGSAGYSWCETKQKCLRVWEESCNILSDVYPIYSDLKWSSAVAKTTTEPISGTIINGYEITATGTINNNVDAGKFFDYYRKLSATGWAIDNYFAADGILGSQVGYNNGGNYIVLNYTITPGKVTSGANEPMQWTCPCSVKYTIFTGQSETGQCVKDSDCQGPQYKCIKRTCQILNQNIPVVCPMYCLQNMLCGSDGKDYCNECLAKAAGATVVHTGSCKK